MLVLLLIVLPNLSFGQSFGNHGLPQTINLCDYCIGSESLTPIEAGQTDISYNIRYLRNDGLYQAAQPVADEGNSIETFVTHQLSFVYSFGNTFSALIEVPFVSRSESGLTSPIGVVGQAPNTKTLQPLHATTPSLYADRNSGLADIRIVGRYKFFSQNEISCSLLAGVKLPTGNTTATNIEGEKLDAHLQAGTGSFDPIIGLATYYAANKYSIALGSLFVAPSTGADGYRFGLNLNVNATLRYNILEIGEASTLFAVFGFSGETHSAETQQKIEVQNTGGTTLYFSPGVRCLVNSSLALEVGFDYPFYHDLRGTQLGEAYRLVGGAQYSF